MERVPFRVAAVQVTPAFLDLERSLDRACEFIAKAAEAGAVLAVFPEAFLPGYPFWTWFIPPGHTRPLRELYARLHANSVAIPDATTRQLCEAAVEARIAVAIGVNERNVEASGTTLFNTLVYIGPDGRLLGRHRKLVPTAAERLVWGMGDGNDLDVHTLPFGRVGGLICWENYMPLARHALSARGIQIHVAPTWDRGEPWVSTMRHIAKESRCLVIGCGMPMRKADIAEHFTFRDTYLGAVEDWINPGGSVIVNPDGKILAGPAEREEALLIAEIDPDDLVGPRWQLDIAGHYSRPDVFELRVHERPRPQLSPVADDPAPGPEAASTRDRGAAPRAG